MRMPEIGTAPRGLAIVIAPIVIIAVLANGKALRKHPLGKHTVAARGLDLFGAETQPADALDGRDQGNHQLGQSRERCQALHLQA